MLSFADSQLQNSVKKLTRLAQEAIELQARLQTINRKIVEEVKERDRLRAFLGVD